MRFVILFISVVLMIDGVVVLSVFNPLLGLALLGLGVLGFGSSIGWKQIKEEEKPELKGWSLGVGEGITYPDKPEEVDNVIIPQDILNLGFQALGGPGSGKSESVAIGYMHYLAHHHADQGFSFFCGKGQKDVYQKALASGVEFDHFFSSELPYSDDVNLMEGEAHYVIDRLSGLLIGQTQTTTFYADEQRSVLSTVVPLLKVLNVPVNLRDLYTILTVEAAAVDVMRKVRQLENVPPHIPELADKFFSQKEEQRLTLIRGMINRLSEFVLGPTAQRLNAYQPSISIEKAIAEGRKIYWHFPLSETSKAIATAITDMLQGVAMHRQQAGGDHQLYPLIYDDWGDFFYDRFGPMAARCRSVNMPLSFLFQSVAQLDKVSSTFRDELDDTVATKIILRIMGDKTAQSVVEKFGQYETLELSQHGYDGGDYGQAKSTQKNYRLKPEDIKDLDVGEAYINTLERRKAKSENKFYRARFPLIKTPGWQFKDWPNKTQSELGIGLNLWDQYMNPAAKRKAIKKQVKSFIEVNQ